MGNPAIKKILYLATVSFVSGFALVVSFLALPSFERFFVDFLPNSMISYYLPYSLIFIYLIIDQFKSKFNFHSALLFLVYFAVSIIFYTLGWVTLFMGGYNLI